MHYLPSLTSGAPISRLVFGCAPAGGSISRRQARRAMDQAFELGITAFDTARSYGYGESEEILGGFAAGKRDRVVIFSKAGIRSLRPNRALRVGKALARRVFSLAPGMRAGLRSTLGRQHHGGHFEPAELRASVVESLRALRVEMIDVLFLHDVTGPIAARDDVFEALGRLKTEGKIGGVGISGAAAELARFSSRYGELAAFQFACARSVRADFPSGFPPPLTGGKLRLGNRAFADLHTAGASDSVSSGALLCEPLIAGACDAVAASMYSPEHIRKNAQAVENLSVSATGVITSSASPVGLQT